MEWRVQWDVRFTPEAETKADAHNRRLPFASIMHRSTISAPYVGQRVRVYWESL